MYALVLGRFHAVTQAQAKWLESLASTAVERIVCVLTSADHVGTKRNPFDVATREKMVRPALERSGKSVSIVAIEDIAQSNEWVDHVRRQVAAKLQLSLSAQNTQVFSSNHDVRELFERAGFTVVSASMEGVTPHELLSKVAAGQPWEALASAETRAVLQGAQVLATVRRIFSEVLTTDDGELGHKRDFLSYGTQMDASLRQKLDDLAPWVKPGLIVDKGCGTGKLVVALAQQFPQSRFVGVDLSREFLRMCDQNTYAAEDVAFVPGNVIDQNVPAGSATCVIYSSVMHEVHSYTGYKTSEIVRALQNCFRELAPGGHVLVRDGISPPAATWRLTFLNDETAKTFERFAAEFRRNAGVRFERVGPMHVRLSAHDANEFLCKKDYLKNWHIEVHEEFGALTLEGWREALLQTGFEPVHLSEYVNGWIAQNRYQGTVALHDEQGAPLPWPATNAVIVGRKPE